MRIHFLLGLALAPAPLLASLNAYEILMFFDMYRSDYEKDKSSVKIAKGCKDCNFEEFVLYIDRLGNISGVDGRFADMMNPDLVYDAKRLLGGLWRDEDNESRPGHPTVIEWLVDRMSELRKDGNPSRLAKITGAMEYAHFSRRQSQAKDMLSYVDGRLAKGRLGKSKTQSIGYVGGQFDEFDSTGTIESVQKTKRAAMRNEIVAIARDINSGSVSTSSASKRSLGVGEQAGSQLLKRAFGEGMTAMSLQRGLDTLRVPARRKC